MKKLNNSGLASKKVIILTMVAILLFAAAGAFVWGAFAKQPIYRLAKGITGLAKEINEVQNPIFDRLGLRELGGMMAEDGYHTESRLDVTSDMPKKLLGVSLTIGVDTSMDKDMNTKQLCGNTQFSVMNYKLADLDFYANEETIRASFPVLGIEGLYIDTKNIVERYNRSHLAEFYGKTDVQDFDLNLFPEKTSEKIDGSALMNTLSDAGKLKKNTEIKKLEKNMFEVVLKKEFLEECGWKTDDDASCREFVFLIELGNADEILSIVSREPFTVNDVMTVQSAEVFFERKDNALSRMQVKADWMQKDAEDLSSESTHGMVLQYEPKLSKEEFCENLVVKLDNDEDTYSFVMDNCYRPEEDSFTSEISAQNGEYTFSIEGQLENIERGRSFDIRLDRMDISDSGEKVAKVTGDFKIAPLTQKVQELVKPQISVWGITKEDIGELSLKIVSKFSGLYGGFDTNG